MAQIERDTLKSPSIDAMLRGLTDRPNVQSTLILSRRDGSIIRATGIHASVKQNTSGTGTGDAYQYQDDQSPDTNEGTKGAGEAGDDAQDKQQNTAEVLASSIFQFVNNAGALGVTLGGISRQGARADGTPGGAIYGDHTGANQETNAEDDSDHKGGEDEVQLLRLRTKHQEIIIFPDPNYICCVVQRVGKAGNGADRR